MKNAENVYNKQHWSLTACCPVLRRFIYIKYVHAYIKPVTAFCTVYGIIVHTGKTTRPQAIIQRHDNIAPTQHTGYTKQDTKYRETYTGKSKKIGQKQKRYISLLIA